MHVSLSVLLHRSIGMLVILGILVGTCASVSEGSRDWILFVELRFEKGSRRKTSRRLPCSRSLQHGIWMLIFWQRVLHVLLLTLLLLHRLKGFLLLFPQAFSDSPCPAPHGDRCPCLDTWIQDDPLVRRYQRLFRVFDFSFLPTRSPSCIPLEAFLKAYLIMVDQKIPTFSRLRRFLLEHPALTLSIGFRSKEQCMHLSPSSPAWEQIVPSDRYLRAKIQGMEDTFFKILLEQTIQQINRLELLDGTVACDVKEIWAHVCQNNPKQFVKDRWKKDSIPTGNPDARLGAKPSSNKDPKGKKLPRLFWGFESALFAASTRVGLVVLAESTHPANVGDVSCVAPLLKEFLAYGLKATIFLADAAFDAWYVYQDIATQGGKAYIPLNARGHDILDHAYSPNGKLLCPAGFEMKSGGSWFDKQKGYRRKKWLCPHRGHALSCTLGNGKPNGCTRVINLDDHHRFDLDRSSTHFKHVYKDRTVAERAFSTFQDYGRHITYQRNIHTVTHLNTLTYALINAHVLLKATPLPTPT